MGGAKQGRGQRWGVACSVRRIAGFEAVAAFRDCMLGFDALDARALSVREIERSLRRHCTQDDVPKGP